jgi:hypothetical protein
VYAEVARSTFDTPAYAHIRRFEKQRDGRQAMLTLKVQFGGTSFNMSRSKMAHDFLEKATYLEHVAKFSNAYNELELVGEPLPEHVKVRKFCMSLTEPFMSDQATTVMTSPGMEDNFAAATARLQMIQDAAIKKQAAGGSQRYVAETGMGKRGSGGGGGGGSHPRKRQKKKGGGTGGGAGGLQLHGYSDKQWHTLPAAIKAKVNAGCAAEKAAQREAAAAASAKSADADKDKEAEKSGIRFGKGTHA